MGHDAIARAAPGPRKRERPVPGVAITRTGQCRAVRTDETPVTVGSDPDDAPTARERLAELIEDRLDVPMAVLAVVWTALVAYELIAPPETRGTLALIGNVIWGVFALELVAKLVVAGNPLVFLRRRWPSVLFLACCRPCACCGSCAPCGRCGSCPRPAWWARRTGPSAPPGRCWAAGWGSWWWSAVVVIFGSAQLLVLAEGGRDAGSLGDALWWAANLAISGNLVFEPSNAASRILSVVLAAYAVVVFASVAATLGAFFIESRAERAAAEEA
jgi:voltage-gated potassium channel